MAKFRCENLVLKETFSVCSTLSRQPYRRICAYRMTSFYRTWSGRRSLRFLLEEEKKPKITSLYHSMQIFTPLVSFFLIETKWQQGFTAYQNSSQYHSQSQLCLWHPFAWAGYDTVFKAEFTWFEFRKFLFLERLPHRG